MNRPVVRDRRPHIWFTAGVFSREPLALVDDPAAGWAFVVSACMSSELRQNTISVAAILDKARTSSRVVKKLVAAGAWHQRGHSCGTCDDPAGGSIAVHADGLFKPVAIAGDRPTIPVALRRAVYDRDGWSCIQCGALNDLSLDHVFPFSLGGPDTFENLQTLCRPCNSRKGARV